MNERARRMKVRFPEHKAMAAALAIESPDLTVLARNAERRLLSVDACSPGLEVLQQRYGARVVPERQYELDHEVFAPMRISVDDMQQPSLEDVLSHIRAPIAWQHSRGRGTTIAIVDTGIDGDRPEFPASRRVGGWAPPNEDAWTDYRGHGTMCASIAAGTKAAGGAFDGVAPEASLISCRTSFYEVELATIYDYLRERALQGERIIANNSFGLGVEHPPANADEDDFENALSEAIEAGVIAIFSAGNNHNGTTACTPSTIWLYKCRNDVMTVAGCDLNNKAWFYSSRGPGQRHLANGASYKPDVTAPTPENGRVVYGDRIKVLRDGWGTSGAAPQVAGLVALMCSAHPKASRDEVFDAIRNTARKMSPNRPCPCTGAGLIDCAAAVQSV